MNDETQSASEWRVEYDNDTHPDGDGGSSFDEWWSVTDGKHKFRAEYQDDAELLAAALNGRKDAERYRWLRTAGAWESEIGMDLLSEDPLKFDAEVDANMLAARGIGAA